MLNWINKICYNVKNGIHYTYDTYFSVNNNNNNTSISENKDEIENKNKNSIHTIEKIDILESPRWFCVWDNDDDKYRFIHIDELTTMNHEFKQGFLHNQYLKDKYNPFLGIREYDTQHYENYIELSNLYKNGLEINIENIDTNTRTHPIIQCALANNMDLSPRLKNYYDRKINCFYLEGIVDDNYLKEYYNNHMNCELYGIDDYFKLFENNDIILH